MKLLQGNIGNEYKVRSLQVDEKIMRRLEALGIFAGTKVLVLNKRKNGAVIIKARGARWAIGREIAEGIEVEAHLHEGDN